MVSPECELPSDAAAELSQTDDDICLKHDIKIKSLLNEGRSREAKEILSFGRNRKVREETRRRNILFFYFLISTKINKNICLESSDLGLHKVQRKCSDESKSTRTLRRDPQPRAKGNRRTGALKSKQNVKIQEELNRINNNKDWYVFRMGSRIVFDE